MKYFILNLFLTFLVILSSEGAATEENNLFHKIQPNKIWDIKNGNFISEKDFIRKLGSNYNLLLGIDDKNPEHYQSANRVIRKLSENNHKPIILLGNVERSKQNAFAIFASRQKDPTKIYTATGLDMLLDWQNNGQASWAVVRPVFDVALEKRLSLEAVNFSRYEIGKIHKDGLMGLPEDIKASVISLLSDPLPDSNMNIIKKAIKAHYCLPLPPEVVDKLSLIQRAQNSLFALNLSHKETQTTILIAQKDHIAKATGIPFYLHKLDPDRGNISLTLIEIAPDIDIATISQSDVDFIWFTRKNENSLHCP
ncbi:MAG: ChaN family lipoprotein [Emcibacter sp.]|nr:ChaN family lipoprotein [Emcibacter sp.]